MNDGLRTDIFLRYRPETIACACIHLAARTIAVSIVDLFIFRVIFFLILVYNFDISRNLYHFRANHFPGLKRLMQVTGMYRRSHFCFCRFIHDYGYAFAVHFSKIF